MFTFRMIDDIGPRWAYDDIPGKPIPYWYTGNTFRCSSLPAAQHIVKILKRRGYKTL